jgi:hypothetical protein
MAGRRQLQVGRPSAPTRLRTQPATRGHYLPPLVPGATPSTQMICLTSLASESGNWRQRHWPGISGDYWKALLPGWAPWVAGANCRLATGYPPAAAREPSPGVRVIAAGGPGASLSSRALSLKSRCRIRQLVWAPIGREIPGWAEGAICRICISMRSRLLIWVHTDT